MGPWKFSRDHMKWKLSRSIGRLCFKKYQFSWPYLRVVIAEVVGLGDHDDGKIDSDGKWFFLFFLNFLEPSRRASLPRKYLERVSGRLLLKRFLDSSPSQCSHFFLLDCPLLTINLESSWFGYKQEQRFYYSVQNRDRCISHNFSLIMYCLYICLCDQVFKSCAVILRQ